MSELMITDVCGVVCMTGGMDGLIDGLNFWAAFDRGTSEVFGVFLLAGNSP